ncbi:MAG: efflux RND transporter periplasmic adaptor subunit [Gammaproteobacteria bacterium]
MNSRPFSFRLPAIRRWKPFRVVTGLLIIGLVLAAAMFFVRRPASSAEAADPVPTDVAVSLGKIQRMTLRAFVTAYGTAEAEPARDGKPPASASVAAQSAGLVTEALCEEGRKVERGQVLFRLDHRLADVQIKKARTVLKLAEENLALKLPLSKSGNVSQKLLQEARQQLDAARQDLALAETQSALLQVNAPLSGTIVKVNVRPGEAVGTNAVLAELVDLDRLVANVAVPGVEVPRLRYGQAARLAAAIEAQSAGAGALPEVSGSVSFIGLQVDPKTATVPVRVALPPNSGLRPGQFVQTRITVTERLAVPTESAVSLAGESAIYVIRSDRAIRNPVRLGIRDGDFIEVEGDGLEAGMALVTEGAWGLPDGSRIHAAAQPNVE